MGYAEDFDALIGTPKRGYDPGENRCPHVKRSGEQCKSGVMAGSEKCAVHSGITNPHVAAKRKTERLLAQPEVAMLLVEFSKDGAVTDPAELLRRAAGALERVAEHFAKKIGDGTTDPNEDDLRTWVALTDRLTRLCIDLAKLGLFDKALDASEIVFRREYQELAAQIIDDLEPFPEAAQYLASQMRHREAMRLGQIVQGELA